MKFVKHKETKNITSVIRLIPIYLSNISHLIGIISKKSYHQVRIIPSQTFFFHHNFFFFIDFSKTFGDNWLFPSFEDYTGSATGLMRLQDTYKLNTSQLANGDLSSKFKSRPLNGL